MVRTRLQLTLIGHGLRTLLRKLSLGLSALVLDPLLANVLHHRERDRDERDHDRDYEQVHPVPDWLPADLSKRPRLALARLWGSCAFVLCHPEDNSSA